VAVAGVPASVNPGSSSEIRGFPVYPVRTSIGQFDDKHNRILLGYPSEAFGQSVESLPQFAGYDCASDVVSILNKKRVPLEHLDVIVTGKQAESHPRVCTQIHIEYIFYGDSLKAADLERAIALSQDKYCPVTAMLKGSCELSHSYRVAK